MAGSAVFSYELTDSGKSVELIWLCTADISGNVSSPTLSQSGNQGIFQPTTQFTGIINTAKIIPGTAAAGVQPSDNYDVELRDSADSTIDYLGGMGDNCSQTNTRCGTPVDEVNAVGFRLVKRGLIPYATNCGASKQFTIKAVLDLEG